MKKEGILMDVYVCVGSSCHLRGSHEIIQIFQQKVKEGGLEDKVNLNASFCLGHCMGGVAVKVGEEYLENVSPENAAQMFDEHIAALVE